MKIIYSANVVIMFCICRSINICINTDTGDTNSNLNKKKQCNSCRYRQHLQKKITMVLLYRSVVTVFFFSD